jgi:hypothetical protein
MTANQAKTIAEQANAENEEKLIKGIDNKIRDQASKGKYRVALPIKFATEKILQHYRDQGFKIIEDFETVGWVPPRYLITWDEAKTLSPLEFKEEEIYKKLEEMSNDFN